MQHFPHWKTNMAHTLYSSQEGIMQLYRAASGTFTIAVIVWYCVVTPKLKKYHQKTSARSQHPLLNAAKLQKKGRKILQNSSLPAKCLLDFLPSIKRLNRIVLNYSFNLQNTTGVIIILIHDIVIVCTHLSWIMVLIECLLDTYFINSFFIFFYCQRFYCFFIMFLQFVFSLSGGTWCPEVSVLFHVSSSPKQILIDYALAKKKKVRNVCVCCSRNVHYRLPRMDRLWEQHRPLILEQSLSRCKSSTRIH